jgi:Obg family GTPase CgtA-like protein
MNWDYYESVDRFQRILDASGITESLKENGAKEGDLVMIGAFTLDHTYFTAHNNGLPTPT